MPALFHTDAVQEHIFPLPEEIRTLKVTKMNWPLEKDISLHLFKKKKVFFIWYPDSNINTSRKKIFSYLIHSSFATAYIEVSHQLLKYVSVTTMLCKSGKGGMLWLWQTCKYPRKRIQDLYTKVCLKQHLCFTHTVESFKCQKKHTVLLKEKHAMHH